MDYTHKMGSMQARENARVNTSHLQVKNLTEIECLSQHQVVIYCPLETPSHGVWKMGNPLISVLTCYAYYYIMTVPKGEQKGDVNELSVVVL